jgi:MFS family permease
MLAACSAVMFVGAGIGLYTFPVFLLPLERHFATSRTLLTLVGSFLFLASGLSAPAVGVAVHRWGPRWVIAVGGVLCGIGYGALGSATELWHLFVLGLPVAVGIAATTQIPNQTLISQYFDSRRGSAMGVLMMAGAIGGIVWAPAALALIGGLGWQWTYRVLGLAMAGVVVPAAVLVLRPAPQSTASADGGGDAESGTVGQVVGTPAFWDLFAMMMLSFSGLAIVTTQILGIVAASALGEAVGEARAMELGAGAISAFLVASIPGAAVAGWLADRWRKNVLMALVFLLFVVASALLLGLTSIAWLGAFAACYGFALGGLMVVFSVLLAERFGVALFSRLMGIQSIALTLGMAGGPLLGARIFDATGSYRGAFVLMIGLFGAAALLALGVGAETEVKGQKST